MTSSRYVRPIALLLYRLDVGQECNICWPMYIEDKPSQLLLITPTPRCLIRQIFGFGTDKIIIMGISLAFPYSKILRVVVSKLIKTYLLHSLELCSALTVAQIQTGLFKTMSNDITKNKGPLRDRLTTSMS